MSPLIACAAAILLCAAGARAIDNQFIDATVSSGIGATSNNKASWGDYNGDGWVDLSIGGQHLRNFAGTFTVGAGHASDGIFGDYDNDGDLDWFNYVTHTLARNNGDGTAWTGTALPGVPSQITRGAVWGDFDGNGFLDLYIGGYELGGGCGYCPDSILNNNGNHTFSHTWTQPGDSAVSPGAPRPGRGITTADWDEDGDLDVYVSNYRLEPNSLRRNNGLGSLAADAGVSHFALGTAPGWAGGHSIGSVFGDVNNDGLLDIFVGNFAHAGQPQSEFLINQGPGQDYKFLDTNNQAGVAYEESYASPTMGDIDNDGDLDLFFSAVNSKPNRLWVNQFVETGSVSFIDGNAAWFPTPVPVGGNYQAAFADYDDDGDLDLISGGKLYQNSGNDNHYLKVRLHGAPDFDVSAIGTQVQMTVANQTYLRQVESAVGEGNQNDPMLHFGLDNFEGAVTLEVKWPDGTVENVQVDRVDHTVFIKKGGFMTQYASWSADASGQWNDPANWGHFVLAGDYGFATLFNDVISAPRTVTMGSDMIRGMIQFNTPHGYTIFEPSALRKIKLQPNTGNALINVLDGGNTINARVEAIADVDVDVAAGASLSFSGLVPLELNGKTLTKKGAGSLTLPSFSGGGSVIIEAGELVADGVHTGGGFFAVQAGATMVSEGVLQGSVFNFGLFDLGPGAGDSSLFLAGDYLQGAGAVLQMEISGATQFDELTVSDGLTANGTLRVLLAGGYAPVDGDQFQILDVTGTVTGAFAAFDLPALSAGLAWDTDNVLTTGVLQVVASLLLGDADNDGAVTADDLIAVQQNFGNVGPPNDGTLLGDANDDGAVTADDLVAVQQNFGSALGPAGGGAVPEPATAAILAVLGLRSSRRRIK